MGFQFQPINPATGLPYAAGGAVPGSPQAPNPDYQPGGSCSYPEGQCTWGVAQTYPVFFKMACMGNGCQWWGNAQSRGWGTSSKPFVGAVVCYACNLPGSGGDGHVAVVTAVHSDGTFDVHEYNWTTPLGPDTRHVTSMAYIQGFFSPPGGPVPGTGSNPTNALPATGARGLPCQYALSIPGIPAGNLGTIGGWNICMDGLIGVIAIAGGIIIVAIAGFMAIKPHAERAAGAAATVAGTVSGQPEVAAAGEMAEQQGNAELQQRARRSPTANHLSVQEQQTRRNLMATGYSSVQATRGARMAGSTGTPEERLTRGLRSLGATS